MSNELHDAIQFYHDLLTGDVAVETQAALDDQQRRQGLFFGGRALCTVLRPRMITWQQLQFLQSRVKPLLSAFHKCHVLALRDPGFRRQFALRDPEEELIQIESGFECDYPTSRLDSFFVSEGELRFTEFNSETPAGAAYNDAMSEVFAELPVVREFGSRYQLLPLPARPGVANELLRAFRQWSGRSDAPQIAILDWPDVPTQNEFALYQKAFRAQGIACEILSPSEVEYRDGRLVSGNYHITLIYKRVLVSELI
ncbi:MAG TPA: hypothetical protein VIY86_07425, partial [Pirellulaceae bacterium]